MHVPPLPHAVVWVATVHDTPGFGLVALQINVGLSG
jgi:hypothetical protein